MIGITMGDPNGVGPEILLSAWQSGELGRVVERAASGEPAADAGSGAASGPREAAGSAVAAGSASSRAVATRPGLVVVGDLEVLDLCSRRLDLRAALRPIAGIEEAEPDALNVLDLGAMRAGEVAPGVVSARAGGAARAYVERAVRLALERRIDAMVTLPVNKEAVRLVDPAFTGHTEMIAELCGSRRVTMMLASERLAVTHVSTHVALAEAIARVRRERVLEVIHLTHEALARFIARPRLAVAGLNPHAGEHGSFGREEIDEIGPAIDEARSGGLDVSGPEPPDTVFFRAARGAFDAVVCMYHDQGHIPSKLLDFEGGVNVTLGLPIVRTSVDHGTAFDIAYKGMASTRSLVEACRYAWRLIA